MPNAGNCSNRSSLAGLAIRFSEEVHADGAEFFRAACELGLDGTIAKRGGAPCRSVPRPESLKIKGARRDTFLIVGYQASTMPGRSAGYCAIAGVWDKATKYFK